MRWELILAAVALAIMLEGLAAMAAPAWLRRRLRQLTQLSDFQFRVLGLVGVTAGVALLSVLRLWL